MVIAHNQNKMANDDNNSWGTFRLIENFCDQSAIIASQKEEIAELRGLVKAVLEGIYIPGKTHEIMVEQSVVPYCFNCGGTWDEKLAHICKCGRSLCDKCVSEDGPECDNCVPVGYDSDDLYL